MTNGVLTNHFNIDYCYEAIDRDFDIFVLTKEDTNDIKKINLVDIPSEKHKFLAVQYSFGKNVLVLFRKGCIDEYEYRSEISEKFVDVSVKKLDIFDRSEREKYFYFNDRLLAQLLMNSMTNPVSEKFSYHNITGKLYYSDPDWIKRDKSGHIKTFYTLEVKFSPGMFLKLNVKTFKKKFGSKTYEKEYVFDQKTGALRVKLKDDEKCDSFVIGSYSDSHNTVDYIDFINIGKFRKCKLGVMKRILDDISEKLGQYISLIAEYNCNVKCFEVSKEQKNAMDKVHLAKLIDAPIHIVDELHTAESETAAERIKYELEKIYGLEPVVGDIIPDGFNIRLIHDADYYKENNVSDIHSDIPEGVIIQHITLESALDPKFLSNKESGKPYPMINKVLQELVIKRDVIRKKVTVFDWEKSGPNKPVTFVVRNKIAEKESKPRVNTLGRTVYFSYEYKTVEITPDGQMSFDRFSDTDEKLNECQDKIIHSYEAFHEKENRVDNSIDGLMFYSLDNIHTIIRTAMTTIPDIHAIWNGLEETDPNVKISKELLLDALSEFESENPEYTDYSEMLRSAFGNFDDSIEKGKINAIMDYRHFKNAFKKLNDFLYNVYGIRINPQIKCQEYISEYLIDNILDIKYYTKIDEYSQTNEFRYYVGTKRASLQTSVHNACIVRKVISEANTPEFMEMIPLLAVDFVRNNQYTVLPFPFKFLREY